MLKIYHLVSNNNIKQIDFVQIIKSVSLVKLCDHSDKTASDLVCMGENSITKCIKKSDICSEKM